jgi:outer membrane protein OmpA-like peptidoglycan-associated protein
MRRRGGTVAARRVRLRTGRVLLSGLALALGLAGGLAPAAASAQAAPALAGAEVRTGLTFPEHATAALGIMVEGDAGYVWRPRLRLLVGVSHFRANIDREPGDNEGSFAATGLWVGGRYDLLPWQAWGPYVRAVATMHRVDADAWDPTVDALLAGTNLGLALAAGARYGLDATGRLSATFEVRRTLLNNLNQTSLEVGLRFLRRGSYAYVADAVALAPRPVPPPAARPPAAPAVPTREPDAAVPAPPAIDTAAARLQAQAAAQAAEEAATAAALRRAEAAAEVERLRAAAAAEHAVAVEARLRQGLQRAAAVMPGVSSVRETADAYVTTIGAGAFASGAATLTPAARTELRALANVLAGYPGHIVMVEGHTDAQGDPGANLTLSVERAEVVRAALIVEGVDALWTAARGFGDSRPVADNTSAAGRALNRRVEIRVAKRVCDDVPVPGPDGTLICR